MIQKATFLIEVDINTPKRLKEKQLKEISYWIKDELQSNAEFGIELDFDPESEVSIKISKVSIQEKVV